MYVPGLPVTNAYLENEQRNLCAERRQDDQIAQETCTKKNILTDFYNTQPRTHSMLYLFLLLALCAGAILPMQVGMNATLRQYLGSPILASLTSFSVGTLCLLGYTLATRLTLPPMQALTAAPLWSWFGGTIGALYVTLSIVLAPRLGATALIAATIAGQLLASVLIDHFGWLNFSERPISIERIIGIILLLIGVILIQRK